MRRLLSGASTILFLLAGFASTAFADSRVALVVGNSGYVNVSPLGNPANDARLMADTLHALGFTLVGGGAQIDLDKAGLDRMVRAFGSQLQGADVGLFYYAGHGVQVRGANYLVPIDANPTREADVDFQMLDANLVLRQMEGAGTRLNLVVLDACRNNPFGGRGLRATSTGLAQMQAPEGTLISFATQPGNVALDGEGGNSPYTRALAQTIQRPGLGIFDAFNEVGLAVKRATGGSQQPWVSSSPIAGTFHFSDLQNKDDAKPAAPAGDPAAQAWAATKDTTSIAVLEEFIRQFASTPYASMARARLEELKGAQQALAPTTAARPLQPALPGQPMPTCDLEGSWQHGGGGESWNFSRSGQGRYIAREHGFGNATGSAVVEGRNFRIDYSVNNGVVTGTYQMQFAPDCSAATGKWRARYSRGGRWPFTDPDRGDTSMRRISN